MTALVPSMSIYVVAIVLLSALGSLSVVGIALIRPDQDNTLLITSILTFLGPTIASLLAFAIRDIHKSVNSRLDQLVASTGREQRAEGIAQGVAQEQANPTIPASTLG